MEPFKLLITSHSFGSADPGIYDRLKAAGIEYKQIHSKEIFREDELAVWAPDYDGFIVGADEVTRKVIEAGRRLKIISKHGVGLDNIDLNAARERDVTVAAAVGSNNVAVAELTVAMLFGLASELVLRTNEIQNSQWNRRKRAEIFGATLGVIGTGSIGKEVILRMGACGMKILAYDPYEDHAFMESCGGSYVTLPALLAQADFITVHVPLNEQTRQLINTENLKLVKPSACIVNCARGGVVDEDALWETLLAGGLGGVGIDTFTHEPPNTARLSALGNVILTPHLGAYTDQSIARMSEAAAGAVIRFVGEKTRQNPIPSQR